jgi:hypothetical protein
MTKAEADTKLFRGVADVNRITVHEPLTGESDGVVQPVEWIDEAGKRLGHFVPAGMTESCADCPYSPDELDRMQSERGGRPLKEIWASLGVK